MGGLNTCSSSSNVSGQLEVSHGGEFLLPVVALMDVSSVRCGRPSICHRNERRKTVPNVRRIQNPADVEGSRPNFGCSCRAGDLTSTSDGFGCDLTLAERKTNTVNTRANLQIASSAIFELTDLGFGEDRGDCSSRLRLRHEMGGVVCASGKP